MSRTLASLVALMAALPIAAQVPGREPAQPAGWSSSGPSFIEVYTIATPPDIDGLVYAGASQGFSLPSALFQSPDAGASWAGLADAPAGETITTVAINPSRPQEMIAETSRVDASVLYRSPDRGKSWYHALDVGVGCGGSILFDRTRDAAFVACGDRFLRSDDAGTTWVRIEAPASDVYGLAASPDGSILAFSYGTIYRTRNGGASWSTVGAAPEACPAIVTLAVAPDAAETIFAGTAEPTYQHLLCGGVFRSLDGGASWSPAGPERYITMILIDPQNPSRVFASSGYCGFFCPSGGVFMSTDRGETWTDLRLPFNSAYPIALSSSTRTLYAATTGGVFQYRFRRPIELPPR